MTQTDRPKHVEGEKNDNIFDTCDNNLSVGIKHVEPSLKRKPATKSITFKLF